MEQVTYQKQLNAKCFQGINIISLPNFIEEVIII